MTVFAALSLVASAATNAPPVKVVFTSAPPETFPSTWTGANVRIDFGHTPLQRAPTLIQPPAVTNKVPPVTPPPAASRPSDRR